MAWFVLVVSGMFEAVWAAALAKSDRLTRLVPSIVFLLGAIVSMGGLAWAMKSLPLGTSYAIWVGIGAATTMIYSVMSGNEVASPLKILLVAGIVLCVIGLKVAE